MNQEKPDNCRRGPAGFGQTICSISRTDHLYRAAIEARSATLGITRLQLFILVALERQLLSHSGEPLSQKDFVNLYRVSAASVTDAVRKLESAGFLTRTVSKTDNRLNEVRITEEGLRLLGKTRAQFKEVERVVADGITEEELQIFRSVLNKMETNLCKLPEVEGAAHYPLLGFRGKEVGSPYVPDGTELDTEEREER